MTDAEADVVLDDYLPGDWEDVSDEGPFEYHWQRPAGEYPSIRIFTSVYPGYPVEIYPDPRDAHEGVWRTSHDTLAEAAARVRELMERFPGDGGESA